MQRTRLLILVALLVVVIGIVAAFLLVGGGDDETDPAPGPTQQQNVGGQTDNNNDEEETPAPGEPTLTPLPTQELTTIIIAVQPISRGQEIIEGMIGFRAWPVDALPFNAYEAETTELADLYGQIARTDIQTEQPLLTSYLTPSRADLAAIGSDLAAIIPEGQVAIAVPVDRLTSVAYGIQAGDRVDVSVSLLYVDIDPDFQTLLPNIKRVVTFGESGALNLGAQINGEFNTESFTYFDPATRDQLNVTLSIIESPSEDRPRPRLVVQRTVQDALILHVGNIRSDGRIFGTTPTPGAITITDDEDEESDVTVQEQGGNLAVGADGVEVVIRPDIVVVAVEPQEALVMTWLIEAGVPLNFFLRSAADNSRALTDAVTLGYIMDTYEVTLPPQREFSIQPAIEEIRRVILDDLVPLPSGATIQGQGQQDTTGN